MFTIDLRAFDVITAAVCESNFGWHTTVGAHTVRYQKMPPRAPYEMGWTCDCPGFRFRGSCKHIVSAKLEVCHWGQDAFCGSPAEPNPDGSCPKCGGPTRTIRVKT